MDDKTRAKHEKRIRAALMVEFRDQVKRGRSGWEVFERRVADALREAMDETYAAAVALLFLLLMGTDQASKALTAALARGTAWSDRRARDVAGALAKDARSSMLDALPPKPTRADIVAATRGTLTRERAEKIAITETTGANSEGENHARKVIERETKKTGDELVLEVRWITEKDGKVCKICRPLHNTLEPVWSAAFPNGPPAHPNCRCDRAFVRRLRTAGAGTDAGRQTTTS